MEKYHKIGKKLKRKHRATYFEFGAEIQNRMTVGFFGGRGQADANYCHEIALAYLKAARWDAQAARFLLSQHKSWYGGV